MQTLVIAATQWAWEVSKIAEEYSVSEAQVSEALRFYEVHKAETDGAIASELAFFETAHA
ncbi:MAG: hypothetical protein F6K19_41195 [Cyanothece sp. SIO1E1]|nr:hypothetical protein [Cyanothece sp. SIO1E1]